jgi:hypothetical protein
MALTDDQLRVLSEIVGRETDGEQGSAISCLWVMSLEGVAPVAAGEVSLEEVEAALLVLRKEDEADGE